MEWAYGKMHKRNHLTTVLFREAQLLTEELLKFILVIALQCIMRKQKKT